MQPTCSLHKAYMQPACSLHKPTWFLKKLRWGLAKLAVLGKNSLENFVVISCIQRCISCT